MLPKEIKTQTEERLQNEYDNIDDILDEVDDEKQKQKLIYYRGLLFDALVLKKQENKKKEENWSLVKAWYRDLFKNKKDA